MADSLYQIGEPVPVHAEFRNAAGQLTNPTSVTLEVKKPDGTMTSPTPTNTNTGIYDYTIPAVDQAGLWWYSFTGTGQVSAVAQGSFVVEARYTQTGVAPLSPRALVTLEVAREYVLGNMLDNTQDHKLVRRINAMSEATYSYTNREWLPVAASTRKFYCNGRTPLVSFREYDLVSPTLITAFTDYPTSDQTVLTPGSTTVEGDYRLGPVGGMKPVGTFKWLEFSEFWSAFWPMAWGGFEVTIIGTWGIGTIPEDVREAVLIAVEESFQNPERAASRVVGPLSYTEPLQTYEDTGESPWRALPAASRALLADYRDDPSPVLL